jgi:hypothetical protein
MIGPKVNSHVDKLAYFMKSWARQLHKDLAGYGLSLIDFTE